MLPHLFSIALLLAAPDVREPLLPLWALELSAKVLLGAWLFYLGACVGSFLNVVVYRLPRGLNLVYPGSRCPQCGHAIRARDNLPVLGWLLLGGRCRDCGSPISSRYYFVELVVGLLFLLVAIFAAFLPRGGLVSPDPFSRPLFSPHDALPFWCAYGLHLSLAATLLGATLIEHDAWRVPRRLFLPVLLCGLALPLAWVRIRPLPLAPGLVLPDWQAGLADGLVGLAVGGVLGVIVGGCWWLGAGRHGWPKFAPVMLLATVGCVLGWQRAIEIAPLAMLVYALGVAATSRTSIVFPLAVVVLALVLPLLAGLDFNVTSIRDLARNYDQLVTAATAICAGGLAWLAGRLAGPQYFALRPPALSAPETAAPAADETHEPQPS